MGVQGKGYTGTLLGLKASPIFCTGDFWAITALHAHTPARPGAGKGRWLAPQFSQLVQGPLLSMPLRMEHEQEGGADIQRKERATPLRKGHSPHSGTRSVAPVTPF